MPLRYKIIFDMVTSKLKTDEAVNEYEYQIDGAGRVLFNVRRTASHFIVEVSADTNMPLELRFGIASKTRKSGWADHDWHLPSKEMILPEYSTIENGSARVPLNGKQQIFIPVNNAPLGIKFVIKHQRTDNWFNNNGNNFYLPVNDVYHNIPIHLRYAFRKILDDMQFVGFQKDNGWEYSPEWFGFSNWVQDENRQSVLEELNARFKQNKLAMDAVLSGEKIVVIKQGVGKTVALSHFCLKYNLNSERVAGFGDQPKDIDEVLCNKPLQGHALLKDHDKAWEIESVLDSLNEDELDAYVFDFDGVIQGFYEKHGNLKALQFIIDKIRAKTPVAIITSRPEGEARLILDQLREYGFGQHKNDNKYFTMYTNNGARLMLEGEYYK
ncbi:MAG: HAD family hydrolase [Candidatus Margulisiibacteriota bacterium]